MSDNQVPLTPAERDLQAKLERTAAEIQRDAALNTAAREAARSDQAELQRDVAINAVDNIAAERNVMADAAAIEAEQRRVAELKAHDARLAANQAAAEAARLHTERNILRENLATEREAASTANFGFTLLACLVLAGVIALGVWYYTNQNSAAVPVGTTAAVPVAAVAPANPVVIHDQPAPVVVQQPTKVIVKKQPVIVKEKIVHDAAPAANTDTTPAPVDNGNGPEIPTNTPADKTGTTDNGTTPSTDSGTNTTNTTTGGNP